MWGKALGALALLLLFSQTVFGEEVIQHTIEVRINEDGDAGVIEGFKFQLISPVQVDSFENLSSATTLEEVKAYSDDIGFFVKTVPSEYVISTDSSEGTIGWVNLEYSIAGFATRTGATAFTTRWKVDQDKFNFEHSGQNIVLPEKTMLTIAVPAQATVLETEVYPKQGMVELESPTWKKRSWTGPQSSSKFVFTYEISTGLEETTSMRGVIEELEELRRTAFTSVVYLIVAIVLLGLVILFKSKIMGFLSKGFQE